MLPGVLRALIAGLLLLPSPGAGQFPADTQLVSLLQRRVDDGRAVGIVLGLLQTDGTTRVLFAGSAGEDARPLGPRTLAAQREVAAEPHGTEALF